MIYLTKHETTAAYDAVKDNLEKPHVALIEQTNGVAYQPYVPPVQPEYVDLGLPSGTKWATMNVGASSETNYGDYYMYGKITPYNSSDSTYYASEDTLPSNDDAATQVYDNNSHIPTKTQFEELLSNTDVTSVTINGVSGKKYTNKSDNSKYIFLPAGGSFYNGTQQNIGSAIYWTSTKYAGVISYALLNTFIYDMPNKTGTLIRPVVDGQ